ncbi:UNVERIFIED_CONTAM: hypothetical protein Sindi_3076700 [Sesamum indicum]
MVFRVVKDLNNENRWRVPDRIDQDASAAYITALPLDTYRNDKRLVSPGREPVAVSAVLPEALGKSE